jgi:histidinol-phosphate aminotransferase
MSNRANQPKPRPHVAAMAPFVLAERSVAGHAKPIQLAQNENATPPGEAALQALRAATELNRYPEADAASLRHAIAAAEGLHAERIICGAGSMELLSLLAQAYLGPEDEAVISQYGYVFFRTVAEQVGARFALAPERNFHADIDAILAQVNRRTRMVLLANPNNPTGALLSQGEIERLRARLPGDVLLVLDAAYAEYVTEDGYDPGVKLVDAGENTVMIRTFSKIHGLAGLRVGWGYFPQSIAALINRLRHPNNVGTPAIAAASAAIADRAHSARVRSINATLRAEFSAALRALGLSPCDSQTNFVLLPFVSSAEAGSARDFLMRHRGILVRPMHPYGLEHCLRITIGTAEEMREVSDAFSAWRRA